MRVVVDINVLVSAALTPAPGQQGREIFRQAESGYTLILSDFMLWKLGQVLRYDRIQAKFPHLTDDVIQTFIDQLKGAGELIEEQTAVTQESGGSRDPEDNRILAAAVDGKAQYLVTRNTVHFPATFRGTTIIEPGYFLRLLREKPHS